MTLILAVMMSSCWVVGSVSAPQQPDKVERGIIPVLFVLIPVLLSGNLGVSKRQGCNSVVGLLRVEPDTQGEDACSVVHSLKMVPAHGCHCCRWGRQIPSARLCWRAQELFSRWPDSTSARPHVPTSTWEIIPCSGKVEVT